MLFGDGVIPENVLTASFLVACWLNDGIKHTTYSHLYQAEFLYHHKLESLDATIRKYRGR
jgi:hypothetical protein